MKFHLPFGIRKRTLGNVYISKEEFKRLSDYANANHVKLEGFKRFTGNIADIIELIDDIVVISKDFPLLLNWKKSLTISLDENSVEDDFATAYGHIIYLNAQLYNDIDYLNSEYHVVMSQGKFVGGTDYHSVIRHEIGHVIATIYGIDTMGIAQTIFPELNESEIIEYVKEHLSQYAADYKDGREFISESFSAYYSKVDNEFANKYVEKCINIAKGGN